jgi:hypothetical protein
MAAVVVVPPAPPGAPSNGVPLSIFPGSATPTVFGAGVPFWIGCGFLAEPEASPAESPALDPDTRFELEIDGELVPLVTDLTIEGGRTTSKRSVVSFASGLPAGWHRFAGRWYDAGRLVLSSDKSIEFVER